VRGRAGLILGLILAGAVVLSLVLGDSNLGASQLLQALLGRGDELNRTILWDLRLPRTLVGVAVGAGLAASGVTMQAFFRNPLASPGLLGVSAGGALGAVAVLAAAGLMTGGLALGGTAGFLAVPLAAIAGAFLATGAVMALARRGAGPEHLLLSGVALNAFFGAGTWEHVAIGLPGILVGCVLLLPLGRPMNLLSLGEPAAQSLGVDVKRLRWQLIALSTVLTALATAVGGVVGFVGLLVPHLLRLAFGPDHRRLLPLSMVGGAALVLLCDLPTRFVPGGLRLGVVTALIGGPFLLWMLRRNPC